LKGVCGVNDAKFETACRRKTISVTWVNSASASGTGSSVSQGSRSWLRNLKRDWKRTKLMELVDETMIADDELEKKYERIRSVKVVGINFG